MSGVKRRFRKKTGIEYFDTAVELDVAIWEFIKHEFKNKSQKDAVRDIPEMTGAPEGAIPYRYWDTHGKKLHDYAWEVMRYVRLAYQIPQPQTQTELDEKKKHLRTAIGWCWNIHDAISLTGEELPMVNYDKMENIFELISKEIALLDGVRSRVKIVGSKSNRDSAAP